MQTTATTMCEFGGVPVYTPFFIFDDYDGNVRNTSFPDVGADEFSGVYIDLMPPAISFTPLQNTSSTNNRTLTTFITDVSGVPTSGNGLPVLYWSVNGVPRPPVQATYSGTNQYDFSFGSGVNLGNIVTYYIVAHDIMAPPNICSMPYGGSGFSTFPPACSTPPPAPYSYTIVQGMSGNYTVGTSGNYPSLTGAGGLFADINAKVLSGNMTVQIISDLTEDGSNALNKWLEDGPGSYTLTIQPNSATERLISGAVANDMIRLNGTAGVIFDGRFGSSGKYFRIRNTNSNYATISISNATTGSVIRNSYLEGASGSFASGVVVFKSGSNYLNKIEDCEIRNLSTGSGARPYVGVNYGSASDALNEIVNSKIYNFSYYGLYINGSLNKVESCEIYELTASAYGTVYGIWIDDASSASIVKNKIYNLEGSGSSNIKGVYYSGGYGGNYQVFIENNSISLSPTTTGSIDGIDYDGWTDNYADIYYNSIYIGGNVASGTNVTSCIKKQAAALSFNMKDNALFNGRSNSGGSGSHYAVYVNNTTGNIDMNFNDYWTSGTGGVLGYWNAACSNLANWQTVSLQDSQSISANPLFISTSDLRLQTGSPAIGSATPLTSVNDDFFSNVRHLFKPTIGAFEYAPPNFYTWTGSINTDWNTAGNWSPSSVPGQYDDAGIPQAPSGNPSNFPVVPAAGGPFNIDELFLEYGAIINVVNGATLNVK
jgi:hypothetical protein